MASQASGLGEQEKEEGSVPEHGTFIALSLSTTPRLMASQYLHSLGFLLVIIIVQLHELGVVFAGP